MVEPFGAIVKAEEMDGFQRRQTPRITVKAAVIGVAVTALVAPISASGRDTHRCSVSPQRSGGISEMAPCGTLGERGNRGQFVTAITRAGFLSRLAH